MLLKVVWTAQCLLLFAYYKLIVSPMHGASRMPRKWNAFKHPPLATPPQVVDFCNNYTQLLGMGFSPAVAAGALVKAKNDATAATDLCLATSS